MEKYFEIELMIWTFQCDLNEVMAWKDAITFFSGVKHVSGMGGGGGMAVPSNSYISKVERSSIEICCSKNCFLAVFSAHRQKVFSLNLTSLMDSE